MSSQQPRSGLQEQLPQSAGQLLQFSPVSQMPLPHEVQVPQSLGQDVQFSDGDSQMPFPHDGHAPQSVGQVLQLSVAEH
jgi:hypothetical protein